MENTSVQHKETVRTCPFDYAQQLEFDPQLRQLLTEEPVSRIRMAYGEGEAWLVTRYEDVRTVTTDRRFSRSAVLGRDFPRMTPEPIVQAESINLMDPPASSRLRSLVAKSFTPAASSRCAAGPSGWWTGCWTRWRRRAHRPTSWPGSPRRCR